MAEVSIGPFNLSVSGPMGPDKLSMLNKILTANGFMILLFSPLFVNTMHLSNQADGSKSANVAKYQLDFDQVVSALEAGKLDLGDQTDYDLFAEQAALRYPNSNDLFKGPSPATFISNVIEKTNQKQYTQGLYMAQLIAQYAPFTGILNFDKIAFKCTLKNIRPEFIEVLSRISYRFGITIQGITARPPYLGKGHTFQHIISQHGSCQPDTSHLHHRSVILFLGDGTIKNEVDLQGKSIEGGQAQNTTCLLNTALQEVISDIRFQPHLNESLVRSIQQRLVEANSITNVLGSFALDPHKYQKFESIVLERLEAMEVGTELLMPSGFRGHATLTVFVKRTAQHYDVLSFNSGDGLQYH